MVQVSEVQMTLLWRRRAVAGQMETVRLQKLQPVWIRQLTWTRVKSSPIASRNDWAETDEQLKVKQAEQQQQARSKMYDEISKKWDAKKLKPSDLRRAQLKKTNK